MLKVSERMTVPMPQARPVSAATPRGGILPYRAHLGSSSIAHLNNSGTKCTLNNVSDSLVAELLDVVL